MALHRSDHHSTWQGCFPIVVTPFKEDGDVDIISLHSETDHLIENGVHGLTVLAIASEGYKISENEREVVIRTVINAAEGKIPVIVSVGHESARGAEEKARDAFRLGAQGLMVLPPSFVRTDEIGLFEYFARVAQAAPDLPIILQDIPQLTGVSLSPGFLNRLKESANNITAVKIEALAAGRKISAILEENQYPFTIFSGWGGITFWDGLLRGVSGCMPAPNFAPYFTRVFDLYVSKNLEAAFQLFTSILPFVSWSMQTIDLSIWTAKQSLFLDKIIASSRMRSPAILPDDIDKTQFENYLLQLKTF